MGKERQFSLRSRLVAPAVVAAVLLLGLPKFLSSDSSERFLHSERTAKQQHADEKDHNVTITREAPNTQQRHANYSCPYRRKRGDGPQPSMIRLKKYATMLHLGKGGGGTIRRDRMQRWWLLMTEQCHGHPCNDQVSERTLQQNQRHGFLVNVRDPVDRFVSSFYWPILLFCDPEGNDPRKPLHAEVVHREQEYCTTNSGWKNAFMINYYEFGHDINQLALALCDNNNQTRNKLARHSIQTNKHARHMLSSWFGFMTNGQPYDPSAIYPIVLDRAVASMASQTDRAVEWLHNLTHFEEYAMFAKRRDMVRHRAYCQEHGGAKAKTQSFAHTSFSPNTIRPTPKSEKCLVNYFQKEYAVLPQIRDKLCKSDDCRRGIQSILDRRQPLFVDD